MQADCPLFSFFNGLVPGFSHAKDRVDAAPITLYTAIPMYFTKCSTSSMYYTALNKVQTTIVRLLFYTKIKLVGPNPKFLPTTAKTQKD